MMINAKPPADADESNAQNLPLILVTNDDGYQAPGIKALTAALHGIGRLMVVAPDGPRSGASRSFTAGIPVELKKVREEQQEVWYSCSGTPVDSVKLAYEVLLDVKPALLVSGINLGDNASVSLHYSGTMGAAIEGALKHTPSVGFSLASFDPASDFTPCIPLVRDIVKRVLSEGMADGTCLNVNFPPAPHIKGVRQCRAARGEWVEECAGAHHPRGGDWYWFTGRFNNLEPNAPDTDMTALGEGYASMTVVNVY